MGGVGNLFVATLEAVLDYEAIVGRPVDLSLMANEAASVTIDPPCSLESFAGGAAVQSRASAVMTFGSYAGAYEISVQGHVGEDLLIADPGSHSEQTITESNFNTMDDDAEDYHAMPRHATIDPVLGTYTTSGNWPNGSWEQGHWTNIGYPTWYSTPHSSGNYWSAHVRVRRTCEFGRGYIWSIFAGYDFADRAQTRIKQAVDYLASVQIASDPYDSSRDGSWVAWQWRKDYDELIPGEEYWNVDTPGPINRVDTNWFGVGRALAFISMAYVQAVQDGETVEGDSDYTTAHRESSHRDSEHRGRAGQSECELSRRRALGSLPSTQGGTIDLDRKYLAVGTSDGRRARSRPRERSLRLLLRREQH
jgi:hypothetical protein